MVVILTEVVSFSSPTPRHVKLKEQLCLGSVSKLPRIASGQERCCGIQKPGDWQINGLYDIKGKKDPGSTQMSQGKRFAKWRAYRE